ncbi:RWD domain-containing protein 1, partial [Heterocephalus glaber]
NELEALESIYPNSFTALSENPPSFTITVTSEAGENDETVQTTLKFTYSEKYPDGGREAELVPAPRIDAELLEIKKKRIKEKEQAGKNKLSSKQLFETDHNLDTSDIQFLEDAGNNVEVDESLFQELGDLELENIEGDPDYNPAGPGSDSED